MTSEIWNICLFIASINTEAVLRVDLFFLWDFYLEKVDENRPNFCRVFCIQRKSSFGTTLVGFPQPEWAPLWAAFFFSRALGERRSFQTKRAQSECHSKYLVSGSAKCALFCALFKKFIWSLEAIFSFMSSPLLDWTKTFLMFMDEYLNELFDYR